MHVAEVSAVRGTAEIAIVSATTDNVVALPIERDDAPLMPEGEYRLAYRRFRITTRFNRDVLELWFVVADYGEFFGRKLARYYAIKASEKRRNFTARPQSDFVREYTRIFGRRPQFGAASLVDFESRLIVARVETVKTDHRQESLPAELRYSTIRRLIRSEGG